MEKIEFKKGDTVKVIKVDDITFGSEETQSLYESIIDQYFMIIEPNIEPGVHKCATLGLILDIHESLLELDNENKFKITIE